MEKIYVVGGNKEYANWLTGVLVDSVEEANLILFTGGEDVSPSLYNEPVGMFTSFNEARDEREKEIFNKALKLNKHMLGICRGAQLLCVLSGGKLVQHQENRSTYHYIYPNITKDSDLFLPKEILISSDHHQLAYPYNMHPTQYRVIYYARESRYHLDGREVEMFDTKKANEPEIVHYPLTRCLGIQGHPEWMYDKKESHMRLFDMLNDLINKFLTDKL